jgi:5-methylcytosine-specific restriction endonuclease McrA
MAGVKTPRRNHALILWCAATDATTRRVVARGSEGLEARCIHCNTALWVGLDGSTGATLEHIVPRSHGGGNDLTNLAIACARCNHEKGSRHDDRGLEDAHAREIIEALQKRRRERLRPPIEGLALPPLPRAGE